MKKASFFIFALLFSCSLLARQIEHSIVPMIAQYETIENLPVGKYCKGQLQEIHSALQKKQERIRLVTFNMLFNSYDERLEPANRWPERMQRVVAVVQEMQPDLISSQELVVQQLDDLLQVFGNDYGYFGVNDTDRTLNVIFYRKKRFELLQQESLAMTAPHADLLNNALNCVELRDRQTNRTFTLLNTHACFRSLDLREQQAHFIADVAKKIGKRMPVIVTGDFNTFPNRLDVEDLPFYDGDYFQRLLTQETLRDAKDRALLGHVGPISTFTNQPPEKRAFKGTGTPGIFLDHIYVSKEITVLIHGVQPAQVDGHFPSDHLPVLIDFVLQDCSSDIFKKT